MADTDLPRETGTVAEKSECPNCGRELNVSRQADGAMVAETCSDCHPQPTETAEEHPAPIVREHGTEVESGSADYNEEADRG